MWTLPRRNGAHASSMLLALGTCWVQGQPHLLRSDRSGEECRRGGTKTDCLCQRDGDQYLQCHDIKEETGVLLDAKRDVVASSQSSGAPHLAWLSLSPPLHLASSTTLLFLFSSPLIPSQSSRSQTRLCRLDLLTFRPNCHN